MSSSFIHIVLSFQGFLLHSFIFYWSDYSPCGTYFVVLTFTISNILCFFAFLSILSVIQYCNDHNWRIKSKFWNVQVLRLKLLRLLSDSFQGSSVHVVNVTFLQKQPLIFESLKACNFIKKKLKHRCFPVNIVKFLRTVFFIKHLRQLFLLLLKRKKLLYDVP